MTKIMQNIVLFIEIADEPSVTPSKIGHLFMNRFSIDEDAGFEFLKIFYPELNLENFDSRCTKEGMDHENLLTRWEFWEGEPNYSVLGLSDL